jgi:protein-S-isoprenylcysteine O-methyltransferase Ste14
MPLMSIGFFGALILTGLAHRFGWPAIPLPLEIGGLILSSLGYVLLNTAILQNAYASKLLDINQDQVLVDTGLYGVIRHPLYAGGILMILFLPIALGCWWALIPAGLAASTLVIRIQYEEEMLLAGMEGYEDYQARVKYKIIPKVY